MAGDVVQLFSGGMDSLIAWEYLGRPNRLYVKMNHRYQREELEHIEDMHIPGSFFTSDLSVLGSFEKNDADIPLRNLYLAMVAVNLGFSTIWLVVQKDEMSIPDRTREFLNSSSDILSYLSKRTIKVDTPFENMDKTDMVKWYIDNGKDIDTLKDTWACYHPVKGDPCGNCGACFRRYVAFKENCIDPDYELKEEIKNHYRLNISTYSNDRRNRMEKWL